MLSNRTVQEILQNVMPMRQKQNKEAFNNVFKTYKKYEDLLSAHNMENGQAEESMKFISEKYQEFLRNGEL